MKDTPFTKKKVTKKRIVETVARNHVTKAHTSSPKHASSNKKSVSPVYSKKIKRYIKLFFKKALLSPLFHKSFRFFSWAILACGLAYGSYFFISKTFANEVVVSQDEIVARVSKLTPLPNEKPYEIVRVQDEDDLRTQNPFYKDIKNGDYILMYKNIAVIYDLRANSIVATKYVEGSTR